MTRWPAFLNSGHSKHQTPFLVSFPFASFSKYGVSYHSQLLQKFNLLLLHDFIVCFHTEPCVCSEKLYLSGNLQLWRLKFWYRWISCCLNNTDTPLWGDLFSHACREVLRWPPHYPFHGYVIYTTFLINLLMLSGFFQLPISVCKWSKLKAVFWSVKYCRNKTQ